MNFKRYHVSKNLFDESNFTLIQVTSTAYRYGTSLGVLPQGTYTFNATKSAGAQSIYLTAKLNGVYSQTTISSVPFSFTADGDSEYIIRTANNTGTTWEAENYSDMMLNTGSQPLPYEPYSSEVWHDTPHYIHNTSADTITTLPAVVYPNAATATVGLKGQATQSGTPTPQNPIMPSGTGNKTANLFDISTVEKGRIDNGEVGYVSQTSSLTIEGGTVSFTTTVAYRGVCSGFFEIPEGTATITFNFICNEALGVRFVFYDSTKTWLNQDYAPTLLDIPPATANVPSGAKYVRLSFTGQITGGYSYTMSNLMLNTGSTPLPYEPYGIKIPISSASTTTPVYLGEVQSTRRIKKLVLTGEETYTADVPYSRFITAFPNAKIEGLRLTQVFCTHFISVYDGRPISEVPNNSIYSSDVSVDRFFIKTTDYTTAAAFKAYLAAQYAAGTPVTVWYVLATEETGIVNEPIRKIGTYADEVSGITIPVTAGANSFDVLTTLKPSEVSLNYTGWHDASVKEWDGSEWQ